MSSRGEPGAVATERFATVIPAGSRKGSMPGPCDAPLSDQREEAIRLFEDQRDPLPERRGEQFVEFTCQLVLAGRDDRPVEECGCGDRRGLGLDGEPRIVGGV